MKLDPRKTEDANTPSFMAMREPPGRLGDIVRRLKQAPSAPPPLVPAMAPAGETPDF